MRDQHAALASLNAMGLAVLVLMPAIAAAQSALPSFSDPYGGASAYATTDAADATAPKSVKQIRKSAKSAAHKAAKHMRTAAHKQGDTPVDLNVASPLAPPASQPPQPAAVAAPGAAARPDSPLGLDLKWSAANNPYYSTSTSTIPAVNEIKRNESDTPVETGSSLEAGVKLKF